MSSLWDRAQSAYEQRRYDEAAGLLQTLLAESDDDAPLEDLLFRLAVARDALGQHTGALEALQQMLELNPASARGWNNVGIICMRLQRHDEAREAFETARGLDPKAVAPLISLGSLALKQSNPGLALEYLHAAAELEAGNPLVHANLALTLAVFGRLEEAEDALRLATLYGFEQTDSIQQRIEALKEIRAAVLQRQGSGDEDAEDINAQGAASMLARLEQEILALAERRYGHGDTDETLADTLVTLRRRIRSLRRELGLPEVLDSDVVNGINIMTDDAAGERSGE
jgi:tetratricopeptide (TPR) repeat protein